MSKTINVTLPEDVLRLLNEYKELAQKCNAKLPGKKKPNYADVITLFIMAATGNEIFRREIERMRGIVLESAKAELKEAQQKAKSFHPAFLEDGTFIGTD